MGKMSISQMLVWGLLALLIFGLMGFGVTSFSGSTQRVATVGGQTISVNDYYRAFQQELQVASAEARRTVTVEEFRALGGDQAVLSTLLQEAVIRDAADRQGISVSDETISEEILGQSAFAGANGSFDRTQYEFVLSRQGLTVAEFEEQVRDDLSSQLLQTAVVSGVPSQEAASALIYGYVAEERSITWALMDYVGLSEPIGAPSPSDLATYLSENGDAFMQPETRVIAYAWLSPEMILDEVQPDDETLRALYDERIDEYVQGERRLVERLVYQDMESATDAKARYDAGTATFDALVEERNLSLNDIDMGDVDEAMLGAAGEAVFALDEPGVVGPVETPLGPALFRMNAILSATEVPFEDAREELASEIAFDRARRRIDDQITDVDDLLAGGATLEELEAELGMEFGRVDFNAEASDGIAAYESFRAAALEAEEGEPAAEAFTMEDGGLFALRLEEIRPPAVPALEEIEDAVREAWIADQTASALEAMAEEALMPISDGASFEEQGLVAIETPGLLRDGAVEGAPAGTLAAVFEMEEGEARIVNDGRSVAIVRLDSIGEGDPEDPMGQGIRRLIAQNAAQGIARDLLQAFLTEEMREASMTVNDQVINGVLTQIQTPTR